MKRILFALCCTFILAPTALAHEVHHEETCVCTDYKDSACSCHDEDFSPSLKEGTLNVMTPYALEPDTLLIQFNHNFLWSTLPSNSRPAFWVQYGAFIPGLQVDIGASTRTPAEFEFGLKGQLFNEWGDALFDFGDKAPFSLSVRPSFNTQNTVFGAELLASKTFWDERLQISGDYRFLMGTENDAQKMTHAAGLSAMWRVWRHVHLFGDVVLPFDGNTIQNKGFIWSAGLKKTMRGTPHVLSLYVGNSQQNTLSGRTFSASSDLNNVFGVGFNFSINVPELRNLPARMF